MTAPPAAIAQLVTGRVAIIVASLHIRETSARKYLDTSTIRDMAHALVATFADEAPGADPLRLPHDRQIPPRTLGRTIAALTEATRLLNAAGLRPHPRDEPPDDLPG